MDKQLENMGIEVNSWEQWKAGFGEEGENGQRRK